MRSIVRTRARFRIAGTSSRLRLATAGRHAETGSEPRLLHPEHGTRTGADGRDGTGRSASQSAGPGLERIAQKARPHAAVLRSQSTPHLLVLGEGRVQARRGMSL